MVRSLSWIYGCNSRCSLWKLFANVCIWTENEDVGINSWFLFQSWILFPHSIIISESIIAYSLLLRAVCYARAVKCMQFLPLFFHIPVCSVFLLTYLFIYMYWHPTEDKGRLGRPLCLARSWRGTSWRPYWGTWKIRRRWLVVTDMASPRASPAWQTWWFFWWSYSISGWMKSNWNLLPGLVKGLIWFLMTSGHQIGEKLLWWTDHPVLMELAGWSRSESCGQWLDVLVKTSGEWHSSGISAGTSAI